MSSFATINKTHTGNFWDLNPHMIYVDPFCNLYNTDPTKNKEQSSKDMWCVLWLTDPDEEVNKYYRIPKDERVQVCLNFNPNFDINHPQIEECLEKYPYLCLNADELAYKEQKDQLIELSKFLRQQPIELSTVKELIDLKAKMPKIYQDFEKIDKMFQKNKSEQRIFGGRKQTARERGTINPEE